MVTGNNGGGSVDYEPNSFGGPFEDKSVMDPPIRIDGNGLRYITYPGKTNTCTASLGRSGKRCWTPRKKPPQKKKKKKKKRFRARAKGSVAF